MTSHPALLSAVAGDPRSIPISPSEVMGFFCPSPASFACPAGLEDFAPQKKYIFPSPKAAPQRTLSQDSHSAPHLF